jgi:antitoxin HicB
VTEHGYRVIYEPISEGGYQVIVPALPGIITYGRTIEEARVMARDAIICHLEGLIRDHEEIPEDPCARQSLPLAEDITVAV